MVPEFTITALILGILLSVIFGAANAYLGLRVGMTVSASIPAAVLSMGIIRIILRKILSWKTTLFRQSVQPVSLLLPEQSLRSLLYSYGQKKVRLILLVFNYLFSCTCWWYPWYLFHGSTSSGSYR